jgi:hypothetical protein
MSDKIQVIYFYENIALNSSYNEKYFRQEL